MNIFLELRRLGKLAEKRNPMYENNKFAKIFVYIGAAFWIGYLIFFGILFAIGFDNGATEPYHILNAGLVFVLIVDFLFRFSFQQSTSQEVKPFLLLPLKRRRLIDFLLLRLGLSSQNTLWLFMFVPFAILTVFKFYGITGVITYCLGIWLLTVINCFWFQLCRTLMGEKIWWFLLPVAVYGGLIAALLIPEEGVIWYFFMNLGEGFITGNLLTFAGTLAVLGLFWMMNSWVTSTIFYQELNRVSDTKVKHVSEYKFLDRYGEIGEYIRLELKLMLRNKTPRKQMFVVIGVVVLFSIGISIPDIYEGGMRDFIVIYNYSMFALLFLGNMMGLEGNYIDGLMTRKESIYSLLRAKYTLYTLLSFVPTLLMIPAMLMKNLSLLYAIGWQLFTIGFVYFCLFQYAVYNKLTIPLNMKLVAKQNIGTGMQNLIQMAALALPLIINFSLKPIIGVNAMSIALTVIGLGFMATHRLWLKNVYHRFMLRRYVNMEGFRDSRDA